MREAYHRRIPPALVLGVMLTENDGFKRNARSNVGALGLMQIMPRVWTPNLGPILGRDLRDDETNLRYGVYILKHLAKRTADTLDARDVTRIALLRYNGCVTRLQHAELPRVSGASAPERRRERADDLLGQGLPRVRRASALGRAARHRPPPPFHGTETAVHLDSASGDVVAPARKESVGTRLTGWLGGIVDTQARRTR